MKNLKILPHSPKTLVWWFNRKNEINFNPSYQRRGRLWSDDDKACLIDSIINGFDVPKLYLADFQFGQSKLNKTKCPYAIIDGKQRLEAVFDFFEYKLELRKDFNYRKDPSLRLGGLSLKDLRQSYPRVAEEFENASLDIMSVIAEEEIDISEIFVRLNKSKALTGAEVRNAASGPVRDLIQVITKHEFFVGNIRFKTERAADLNAAAKLLLFEYSEALVATKKRDLDKFARSSVPSGKLELAGRRVLDTLSSMSEVFIPRDILLASAGVVPVYYWFIRQVNGNNLWLVRPFLNVFEAHRESIHDPSKFSLNTNTDRFRQDWHCHVAQFNTLNRSTNDLRSHIGRVKILEILYEQWSEEWWENQLADLNIDELDISGL